MVEVAVYDALRKMVTVMMVKMRMKMNGSD
jgi:hypothetical protein|uniref:Uncharacterized protein n=1 Tax=virus sp. ctDYl1 TaxID=2826795 RepID=A0A8S5R939_9VIRU|nr:MAG TPA: hypothetical protein [virus sp. ctDYl1]DAP49116.1 MAG TPA: hypothetical protein [Caudoviricetes sp.]